MSGLKTVLPEVSPQARAWTRTLAILGGALAAYVATALLVSALTGDAIAGAAVSDVLMIVAALAYRWKSTGTPLAQPPQERATTPTFWVIAGLGLVACWFAGQTVAAWIYNEIGSPEFDAVNQAKTHSTFLLVLVTALFLAPIGEESLMRAIAYPALRKHWPPLASAFVTTAVFAVLHGNLVQIALTVPLGMLLAFVYEASQRLWPSILMHVAFNMAASFVPKGLVEGIAHLPMVITLLGAVALLLAALSPRAYAKRVRVATLTLD